MLQFSDLSSAQILDVMRRASYPFYVESLNTDDETVRVSLSCDCKSIGSCKRCDVEEVINNIASLLSVPLSSVTINGWASFFVEDSGCETCRHGQIPNRVTFTIKASLEDLFARAATRTVLSNIQQQMFKKRMEEERENRKMEAKRREDLERARAEQNKRVGRANLSIACEKVSVASAANMRDAQFASSVADLSPSTRALAFSIRKRGVEGGIKAHTAKYGEDSIVHY